MGVYGYRWRQLRQRHLAKWPLCALCAQIGIVEPAIVVHHKIAHRGSEELLFDIDNLVSLCKRCHDAHGQREDKSGYLKGSDVNGYPLDERHNWCLDQ